MSFNITRNATKHKKLVIGTSTTVPADGDLHVDGNAGIGGAPTRLLHVIRDGAIPVANSYDVACFQGNDAVGVRLLDAGDGLGNGGAGGLGNDNGNVRLSAAGNLTLATGIGANDELFVGGTTRLTIDSAGNAEFSKAVAINPNAAGTDATLKIHNNNNAHIDFFSGNSGGGHSGSNLGNTLLDFRKNHDFLIGASDDISLTNRANYLIIDGSSGLTTVYNPGWPLKNEISNSGFDVWSNSTLEAIGSEELTNGDFASDTAWTKEAGWTITGGAAVATSALYDKQLYQTISGLTVGKLYELSGEVTAFTSGSVLLFADQVANGVLATGVGTVTTCFEATATTSHISAIIRTASSTLSVDNISVKEATPGCVAADTKAMDGWKKDSANLTLERYHWDGGSAGAVGDSKDGSFYTAKMVSTAAKVMYWDTMTGSDLDWLARWRGRTVTLGAWVKSSVAAKGSLTVYANGVSSTSTTTGTGWEWLETTYAIPTSATNVLFWIKSDTATTFVSQPMLVFGSAIGSGNYSRPMGEIVWFEARALSNRYHNKTGANGFSTQPIAVQNVEADSNGKIPKGAKAVSVSTTVRDSVSLTSGGVSLTAGSDATLGYFEYQNTVGGIASNMYVGANGTVPCDTNGDIYTYILASGSNTFDIDTFCYYGVQLR
jgi:hypothetical protein